MGVWKSGRPARVEVWRRGRAPRGPGGRPRSVLAVGDPGRLPALVRGVRDQSSVPSQNASLLIPMSHLKTVFRVHGVFSVF